MSRARLFLSLLAALALLQVGCVTMVRVSAGNPIDPAAVARVQSGTPLPEVVATLGAPLEVQRHADGKLLVYRMTGRNTFRLGLDASQVLRFVDTTQLVSEVVGNVRLTIDRVHADEDRLVILFDLEDRVRAVGYRGALADLASF
ncbi:MAG TPA: hypothetical protein DEA08_05560 [Planctomycetes bacterium]|nr:hypothetical protein [Planctomycetota bacterium]